MYIIQEIPGMDTHSQLSTVDGALRKVTVSNSWGNPGWTIGSNVIVSILQQWTIFQPFLGCLDSIYADFGGNLERSC